MDDLERGGGMVRAIEEGYLQRLISEEAFRVQNVVSSGERKIVGVNQFQSDEPAPEVDGYELDEKGRIRQLERLAAIKRTRSAADVRATLSALSTAAATPNDNLMPHLVACAKAYCTVGEIVEVLKERWGEFQQPVVF
jgi:methylmalonyl-CoA mutase N-terminal domain/subunit